MKLKKKIVLKEPRTEKILIPGEIVDHIDLYARYYEETYQEKTSIPDLIVAMIKTFMESDRDFQKWLKRSLEPVTEETASIKHTLQEAKS